MDKINNLFNMIYMMYKFLLYDIKKKNCKTNKFLQGLEQSNMQLTFIVLNNKENNFKLFKIHSYQKILIFNLNGEDILEFWDEAIF